MLARLGSAKSLFSVSKTLNAQPKKIILTGKKLKLEFFDLAAQKKLQDFIVDYNKKNTFQLTCEKLILHYVFYLKFTDTDDLSKPNALKLIEQLFQFGVLTEKEYLNIIEPLTPKIQALPPTSPVTPKTPSVLKTLLLREKPIHLMQQIEAWNKRKKENPFILENLEKQLMQKIPASNCFQNFHCELREELTQKKLTAHDYFYLSCSLFQKEHQHSQDYFYKANQVLEQLRSNPCLDDEDYKAMRIHLLDFQKMMQLLSPEAYEKERDYLTQKMSEKSQSYLSPVANASHKLSLSQEELNKELSELGFIQIEKPTITPSSSNESFEFVNSSHDYSPRPN